MTVQPVTPPAVEALFAWLQTQPDLRFNHEQPAHVAGSHYVDVFWPDGGATVTWSAARGFELSSLSNDTVFGQGHDEQYDDPGSLIVRLGALIGGDRTRPPIGAWLGELRRAAGLSQQQLADRLGVSQSAVAQQEKRSDVSVSVMLKTCAAIGCRLNVSALMDGGVVEWGELKPTPPSKPAGTRTVV